ncbi:PREDICTED: uncharacterized protein LOC107353587 [Acropora digitifera]|uniref:uncharacterized protein LOC107353587 n=1 Tax=Acropora digitifera TaxID=70779 RepID=UPI000779FDC8|nr:PREDICTED: uncharacterized protein LOC107353587 [Acropora digitifera]
MFENANEQFKKSDLVTPLEIADALKRVPYVVEAKQVPCVWNISSFLSTSLRTLHDFGNVHHVWFHKNVEGNVVMHYKRYSKDKWLPDPEDATTFLSDNDRYGILVFNELPSGYPEVEEPHPLLSDEEMLKIKMNTVRLFEHPLMKDGKLEERQLWWQTYLSGNAFESHEMAWPLEELKNRRLQQNIDDASIANEITEGLQHSEDEIPVVYSGPYLEPTRKMLQAHQISASSKGKWPVKKVLKNRINPRTHKREFLVEWHPSWVTEDDVDVNYMELKKKKHEK